MAHTLPVIGASLQIKALAEYRDWLLADQRNLEIQDTVSPDVLDGTWQPLLQQARDALDGYTGRLGIHGPFMGFSLLAQDTRLRMFIAERMHQALAFGAELGAQYMVIHSPFPFFGHPLMCYGSRTVRADLIAQVHTTLEPVLPVAEACRCTLVFETVQDTNPEPLLDLIRSFESPYVRLSLDTGHALISHRFGGPTPDQWVRAAGALLGHLHLQDGDGNLDRHWAPGKGSINWYALFHALAELDHTPHMVLELRNPADIRPAAEWLQRQGLAR